MAALRGPLRMPPKKRVRDQSGRKRTREEAEENRKKQQARDDRRRQARLEEKKLNKKREDRGLADDVPCSPAYRQPRLRQPPPLWVRLHVRGYVLSRPGKR